MLLLNTPDMKRVARFHDFISICTDSWCYSLRGFTFSISSPVFPADTLITVLKGDGMAHRSAEFRRKFHPVSPDWIVVFDTGVKRQQSGAEVPFPLFDTNTVARFREKIEGVRLGERWRIEDVDVTQRCALFGWPIATIRAPMPEDALVAARALWEISREGGAAEYVWFDGGEMRSGGG